MKHWDFSEYTEFLSQDVFIIGGGRSLKGFNFSLLSDKKVIGINDAYKLGPDVVDLAFFSDLAWWYENKDGLFEYVEKGGIAVTHNPTVAFDDCPKWIRSLHREREGLHTECLGYGGGSGPSCVNLALLLGAARVLMIGFDGKQGPENKEHWHSEQRSSPNQDVYSKFNEGFAKMAKQLDEKFPGREVIVFSDDTTLDMFPISSMESLEEHLLND